MKVKGAGNLAFLYLLPLADNSNTQTHNSVSTLFIAVAGEYYVI
jgi:hypothetical protein